MAKNIVNDFKNNTTQFVSKTKTNTSSKELKENTSSIVNKALSSQQNKAMATLLNNAERNLVFRNINEKQFADLTAEAQSTDNTVFSDNFDKSSVISEDNFSSASSAPIKSNNGLGVGSIKSIVMAQKLQTKAQYDIAKSIQSSNNRLALRLHADKMTQELRYHNSSLKEFTSMKIALNKMADYQISIQSDYYKKSLEVKSSILNELKEIKSHLKVGFNIGKNGKQDETPQTEAIAKAMFGGDFKNGLKKGLHKMITDYASQATGGMSSMLPMITTLIGGMGNGGISAKSLLGMGLTGGVKSMAAKRLGENRVDRISNLFDDPGQFFTNKLNAAQFSESELVRALGKAFGDRKESYASVSYDDYRKKDPTGRASFDNKAHKALTDLIPITLSKIESALTGNELKLYNYKSQRYESIKDGENKVKNNLGNKVQAEGERYLKQLNSTDAGSLYYVIDKLGDNDVADVFHNRILTKPASKEAFTRALRSFLYKMKSRAKGRDLKELIYEINLTPSLVLSIGGFQKQDPWPYYISLLLETAKFDKNASDYLAYLLNEANRIEREYEKSANMGDIEHSQMVSHILDHSKVSKNKDTAGLLYSYDSSVMNTSKTTSNINKKNAKNKSMFNSSEVFLSLDHTFDKTTNPFHNREQFMAHNLEVPVEWLQMANERQAIAMFGPRGLNYYNDAINKLNKRIRELELKPGGQDTLEYTMAKNALDMLEKAKPKIFKNFEEAGGMDSIMDQYNKSGGKSNSLDLTLLSIDPVGEITDFVKESLKSYKVRSGVKIASAGTIGLLASMYVKKLGYSKMSTPLIGSAIAGSLMMNRKMQGMVDMLGDRHSELMSDGRTRGEALQAKLMQDMLPVGFATATGLGVNKFMNNYVPYGKLLGPVMGWAAGSMMMKLSKGFLGNKFSKMLNKGLDMLGGVGDSIRQKIGLASGQERYSLDQILGTEKVNKRQDKKSTNKIEKDNQSAQSKYRDLKLASGASLEKVGCGIFAASYAVSLLLNEKTKPEDFIPIANKYIDKKTGGIKLEFFVEVGNRNGLDVRIANSADPKVSKLLSGVGPKKRMAIALTNIETGHYVVAFKSTGEDVEIYDPNSSKTDLRSIQGLKMQSSAIIILDVTSNSGSMSSSTLDSSNGTHATVDLSPNVNMLDSGSGPGDSNHTTVKEIKTDYALKETEKKDVTEKVIGVKVLGGHLEALGVLGTVDAESYREKMSNLKGSLPLGLGKIGIAVKNLINSTTTGGGSFFRSNNVGRGQLETQNAQEVREKQNTEALQKIAGGIDENDKKKPEKKKGNWLMNLLGGLLGLDLLHILKGGGSIKGIPKIFKAFKNLLLDRFSATWKGIHSGIKKFLSKFGIKIPDLAEDGGKILLNGGKEAVEEGVEKGAEKIGKNAGEKVMQSGLKSATSGGKVAKALAKFAEFSQEALKILHKIPIIGSLIKKVPLEKFAKAFAAIGEKLGKKAVEEGAEAGAKAGAKGVLAGGKQLLTASGIGIAVNIAFTAYDVITAIMRAKKIFNVEEVTWQHKLAAGLSGFVISLCTSIPILGWLFIFADVAWFAPIIYSAIGGEPVTKKEEGDDPIKLTGGVNSTDPSSQYNYNTSSSGNKAQIANTGIDQEKFKQLQNSYYGNNIANNYYNNTGGKGTWGGFTDSTGKEIKFGASAGASATTASSTPTAAITGTVASIPHGEKPKFFSQKKFLASLNLAGGIVKDNGCAIAVAKMIAEFMGIKVKDIDLYNLAKKYIISDKSVGIKYFTELGGTISQTESDLDNALAVDGSATALLKNGHYIAVVNKKGNIYYGDPEANDWEAIARTDERLKNFAGIAIFGAIASKLANKSNMGGRGIDDKPRSIGYGSKARGSKFVVGSPTGVKKSTSKSGDKGTSGTATEAAATTAATPATASTGVTTGPVVSGDVDKAIEMMFQVEGGYSNDKYDSGGKTMFGIIESEARNFGYQGDMRNLPKETAKQIYVKKYWEAYGIPQLKAFPVQAAVMNSAVNGGLGRPSRIISAMLGEPSSAASKLKPEWASKLNSMQPNEAALKILDGQDADYERIIKQYPEKVKFQKGWHNRTKAIKQMLGLAGGAAGNLGGDAFVNQKKMSISASGLGTGTSTVASTGCALATAKMILNYIGHSKSDSDLLKLVKTYLNGDNVNTNYFVSGLGGKLAGNNEAISKHLTTNGNCAAILTNWGGRGHWIAVFRDRDKLYIGDPMDTSFKARTWADVLKLGCVAGVLFSAGVAPAKSVTTSSDPTAATATTTTDTAAAAAPATPAPTTTSKGSSQWGGFYDQTGKLISFGKTAAPAAATGVAGGAAPWIDTAYKYLNKHESKDTAELNVLFAALGQPGMSVTNSPWCAAFVSYCIKSAIPSFKGDTSSQYPLTSSEYTKIEKPVRGAVIVWSNGDGHGHTAFYIGDNPDGTVKVIGGNQGVTGQDNGRGTSVTEANRKLGDKFKGYFWPKAASSPTAPATPGAAAPATNPSTVGGDYEPGKIDNSKYSDDPALFRKARGIKTNNITLPKVKPSIITLPKMSDDKIAKRTPKESFNNKLLTTGMNIAKAAIDNTAIGDSALGQGFSFALEKLIKLTENNTKVQEEILHVNKKQEGHLEKTAKNTSKKKSDTTIINKDTDDKFEYLSGLFKEMIK